jgi:hypothetical protein
MIARNVEQVEGIPASLDLGAKDGLKAHQGEDIAQFVNHD